MTSIDHGDAGGDDRTSPLGLWMYADSYLDAANCVLAHSRHPHREPVYLLYGHAIALACKAFLRAAGLPIREIEADDRPLAQLMDACLERGLEEADHLGRAGRTALELLDIGETGPRYIRTGFRRRPDIGLLRLLAERMLGATKPRCVPVGGGRASGTAGFHPPVGER
jgi:hypothetical protein